MTANRAHFLTAIIIMIATGIIFTWWHLAGGCGHSGDGVQFNGCKRIEDNQGLISVLALFAALSFFVAENVRANKAEQASRDLAREQEARDRALARQAREFARRDKAIEELQKLTEFISTVRHFTAIVQGDFYPVLGKSPDMQEWARAEEVAAAGRKTLSAMIPAAPMDAILRLYLGDLEEILSQIEGAARVHHQPVARRALELLENTRRGLDERERDLKDTILRRSKVPWLPPFDLDEEPSVGGVS